MKIMLTLKQFMVVSHLLTIRQIERVYIINEGVGMSKWISVNDRLPDEQGKYLVSIDVGSVNIKTMVTIREFRIRPAYSSFADGDWQTTTHWMPIPEPPKQ